MSKKLNAGDVMKLSPVMPVVTIDDANDAEPLARVLLASGINTVEITLRTDAALDAIKAIAQTAPEMIVGAGTVLTFKDLDAAIKAGARYALAPGGTPKLMKAARESPIPFIPGVSTASEIMRGLDIGYTHFKFFPAEQMGGVGGLMGMLPGVAKMKNQLANTNLDETMLKRQAAIIDSMTPKERRNPDLLKASRKRRIAAMVRRQGA